MYKFQYHLVLTLLNLNYHVLKADFGEMLFNHTEDTALRYSTNCSEILDHFAESASNFTMCSIKHARPIRLCEKCVDQYVKFHSKYEELAASSVNGSSCKSFYVSQDRLDAVLGFHDNIQSIWDKGNCKSCFNWTNESPMLSSNTIHFNKLLNATLICIDSFEKNSSEICEKCMPSYLSLDEYYNTLSSDHVGIDTICMDVVDSMNTTRFIWSKKFECCKLRQTPEIIFLCCTGIISILPLLFYLAVRYCGPMKDLPNVLKQSRFKDIFKIKK